MRTLATTLILLLSSLVAAGQDPHERTGRVQQGLVRGAVVSPEEQQEYGLLSLSGRCSASLLRNNWAITAAHCVDDPDPANPGRFITVPEDSVTLTANWPTVQVRQSVRIISFRPNDVAIIRVAEPFEGRRGGYNRELYDGDTAPLTIAAYGRGINQFASGSGASATPSQTDGRYRVASFITDLRDDNSYSYPNRGGAIPAGGDSGGPSLMMNATDGVLVGVHSSCQITCLPGMTCAGPNPWRWVAGTTRCTDAAVGPLRDTINGHLGAFIPPGPLVGTFGTTPADYQPMWVYAIKHDGEMLWYRKEANASRWLGPKSVGRGWNFKDVLPAGGNSFYALTTDERLLWYRHDGFNDGSWAWKEAVPVGSGWRFARIFSGGEGVVYAVREDGTLLWYRHGGYADGGGPATWAAPRIVGSGWTPANMKEVFSTGRGVIYVVRPDGTLARYLHEGYANGDPTWVGPRNVGRGWQNYRQLIPAGSGVVLAVDPEGRMFLYRYLGDERERGPLGIGVNRWEGPVEIGTGWAGFRKIVALLPVAAPPVVR